MKTVIAAALLLFCLTGFVQADPLYPGAIAFAPSYVSGPPAGFPWSNIPAVGDAITMVGLASNVGAPFTDLLPAGPYEVTFVFEGATCLRRGNWDDLICKGGLFAQYGSGVLTFYLDTTPDADFTLPSSFRDGEVVLMLLQQWDLNVADDDPCYSGPGPYQDNPDVSGSFLVAGGSWAGRVSSNGSGFVGQLAGELTYPGNNVPPALAALGYALRMDGGKLDINGPVATAPTTWGHVKSLYRR